LSAARELAAGSVVADVDGRVVAVSTGVAIPDEAGATSIGAVGWAGKSVGVGVVADVDGGVVIIAGPRQ